MPRRKPSSSKQKKEQLQQKRAVKRGDLEPPPPSTKHDRNRKRPVRPQQSDSSAPAAESARRLQSAFVKLPAAFLEHTKRLSATLPLPRPVPPAVAVWDDLPAQSGSGAQQLTCPRRPKWRYDMSKKEVEKNEEGLFRKWLDSTDALVGAWTDTATPAPPDSDERMPHAPTNFERNLEVWRQLWRVTEISQIILVLLDARCPLLHYPPALAAYLAAPHLARKRTVLVLTKVDVAGAPRADAWAAHLRARFPHLRVVQVEAYAVQPGAGAGGRRAFAPHLPSAFRAMLVDALREAHAELLEPPERLRDAPEKLAAWRPPVRRDVDWDAVLHARGDKVGTAVGGVAVPHAAGKAPAEPSAPGAEVPQDEGAEGEDEAEPEFLTVGLIGQPNVGKSSLLNALFGTQKVRASKTPGKTKHFQTLFWTPEVRLVDCPGLVMPNLVPMETQVLAGILPISRVSAVPLCIYHAAQLLPLEHILGLTHPGAAAAPQDKRTWREPRAEHAQAPQSAPRWTAMDVLTALALKKGWLTAKAGRPDVNRAGNHVLRMLAEGRIAWAFWPPGTPADVVEAHQGAPGAGIWIARDADAADGAFDVSDSEDEAHGERAESDEETLGVLSEDEDEDDEGDDEGDKSDGDTPVSVARSRFALLNLDDGGDDDGSDEGDE
ncbi:P-loop containing nucleoside triphosphate hydrolase protein [Phanerochaete sordida]|uniref:Guanine nucleotide-binding protein-like 1 n=1 Tax=Phanerochaete sordida TaxID=48140 RepID=A0A9P3FYW5_9APHY|nr:P-loop containing nucleoside triphosphate hydrolase protein [Phanerochaete sordida]